MEVAAEVEATALVEAAVAVAVTATHSRKVVVTEAPRADSPMEEEEEEEEGAMIVVDRPVAATSVVTIAEAEATVLAEEEDLATPSRRESATEAPRADSLTINAMTYVCTMIFDIGHFTQEFRQIVFIG